MADLLFQAGIFLVACAVLVKAASQAIKYILALAQEFRITPFMASFVLAGFVSILPEFFVGVNSALEHVPDVGIGALIGNNIVDLTLVIGIVAILGRNIPLGKNSISAHPFLAAMGLPILLMIDGILTFLDGVILVGFSIGYFAWMISRNPLRERSTPIEWGSVMIPLLKFLTMMVLIFLSSRFVVESSVEISHIVGIPEIFAGLFLISLGAALPELTISVQAVLARHKTMGLADIMGNVALDATFSIGVMALIAPFPVQLGIIGVSALVMAFAALLLTTYLDNDHKLTRRDGVALVGLYVVFLVIQFTLNAGHLPVEGVVHP